MKCREGTTKNSGGKDVQGIMLEQNVGARNIFKRRLISSAASRETEKPKVGVKSSSW